MMVATVLGVWRGKQFWDLPFSAVFLDRVVERAVLVSVQGLQIDSGLRRRDVPTQLSWKEEHREGGGVG